jgi:hypothetical protein
MAVCAESLSTVSLPISLAAVVLCASVFTVMLATDIAFVRARLLP